jgi:serine/threonine-protein kinase ULK/ATG1
MQQKIVENYILHEIIGSGQYGKVHRAINTKTNEIVAVKVIPLKRFAEVPKLEEFTTNEIKTLGRINNPNVIRFIEMLKTVNNMYLVYEFCEDGTLEQMVTRKHHLNELEGLKVFAQLINAFKALYRENILHRDLKPSNILVHNGIIKVADFGFCKRLNSPHDLTLTMVGSPIYMAPEILKGYPYTIKSDIWSLGVCLFECLYGVCPFEDKHLSGLIQQIDTKPLRIPMELNRISANTENLLRRMLTKDHKQRIDWQDLLDYPLNIEVLEASLNPIKSKPLEIVPVVEIPVIPIKEEPLQLSENQNILHALMRDRNKILFLFKTLHQVVDKSYNNKAILLTFLLTKKVYELIEAFKKSLSIENGNSRYNNFAQWDFFRVSDEYLEFSRYINEEFEEIKKFIEDFKSEIHNTVEPELQDNIFKYELANNNLDKKYYHSILVSYTEDLKSQAQNCLKSKQDDFAHEILLHAYEILDTEILDDLFTKSFDYTLKVSQQGYFQNAQKCGRDKLFGIVQTKLQNMKSRPVS